MAVAFDTSVGSTHGSTVNNITVAITPASGSDMMLIGHAQGARSGLTLSSLVYDSGGGDEATLTITSIRNSAFYNAGLGYINDAQIVKGASRTVTFNWSKTTLQYISVSTYTGCDQTAVLSDIQTNIPDATSVSNTHSSVASGDMAVDSCCNNQAGTLVVGSGQTHINNSPFQTSTADFGASFEAVTSGSVVMSWSSSFGDVALVSGILTQVVAGGGQAWTSPVKQMAHLLNR